MHILLVTVLQLHGPSPSAITAHTLTHTHTLVEAAVACNGRQSHTERGCVSVLGDSKTGTVIVKLFPKFIKLEP